MPAERKRLILFTRFPVAGQVKTRLIPALGSDGATALHRRLVLRTLRAALAGARQTGAELEVRFDGADRTAMRHWLGDFCEYRAQRDGNLGERMARAMAESFQAGA